MDRETILWSYEKNKLLEEARGVCFEQVLAAIEDDKVLGDVNNSNYPNQRILIVEIEGYVYNVPYVIDGEKVFLKTLFPSRKSKKIYGK
ncbi:toxin [Candidatus Gracilibacteria bacterium]|nr:toxin [Candidatus Gracilibacteria bacterium]